jgi:aminoglycoside/choline kinase family phosphotransferase
MERLQQIESWLKQQFPQQSFTLAPASADASFRRYFRASFADGSTRIIMDAPPQHEDCKPFIHVSQLFHAAGVHVPEVLAQDLERGFLLLTDLGNTTYLSQLNQQSMKALYSDAIDALIKIQLASKTDELPPYDQALLQREMNLFEDWYVNKHLGIQLNDEQKGWLKSSMDAILANNLAQGQAMCTATTTRAI